MTRLVVAIAVVLWAARAPAQETGDSQSARLHRAHVKLTIGVGLLGAAAFVLPVTQADTEWSAATRRTGIALLGTGTTLIVWGIGERSKALTPNTRVGIAIGRTNAFRVSREW